MADHALGSCCCLFFSSGSDRDVMSDNHGSGDGEGGDVEVDTS